MNRGLSIAELKSIALGRLEDILATLCPGGRTAGGLYTARNPTRDDRKPGSFVVYISGAARGAFIEFLDRDREKGDLIDLVSYVLCGGGLGFKGKQERTRALAWLADFCGVDRLPDTARAAALDAARRRRNAAGLEAAKAAQKRERLLAKFAAARPLIGSPAEAYLAGRGLPIARMANLETDLRFLPHQEYWPEALRDGDRKLRPGPSRPAMIAAMRAADGRFAGLHFTFLAEDGSGKAKVEKPKLVLGTLLGSVIRLARGESGMTPEEAGAAAGPCCLSEGIEDGLSLALGAPELRVWAAVSLSNMANVPALPCVDAWLVHRQNDWASYAAVRQFDAVRQALEATGRPVAEIASHAGKDINDLLRA